ncbi:MAG: 50S ribosomal protein L25 [Candidatus Kerfeldbacteria bacterium]|nr:50S ribosomal protein L25 [Candidatus Kerfeldbacteria bacterium]
MDVLTLPAQPRAELGKTVDHLRRQHRIPAVVYGHGVPSQTISVDERVFQKIYRQAGSSSLVDLVIGEQGPTKVLIQSLQRHPTTHGVTHIDFYQVKMTEKIETEIELHFVGESAAVKESGGIFIRTIDKVKVECLPGDLVPSIDVDVSVLKTFEDRIHISDIVAPKGITIMEKSEDVVASVTPPRSEEEIAALSEKVEENVEAVEVEKKEKAVEEPTEEETKPSAT